MAMAPNLSLLLLTILFVSPSLSISLTSKAFSSPDLICDSTPYPDFCKSTLPNDMPGTVLDYGRVLIKQSLSRAENYLSRIEHHLRSPSITFQSATFALEDCQLQASLNIDFLSSTLNIVDTQYDLDSFQADDLHSLLSAVLTNLQTCSDGLEITPSASSIWDDLKPTLSDGLKSHSVSLALFKQGWVHGKELGRLLAERQLFEVLSNVSVSQIVVVNPNGSGNFTTINDAVAAAPNNTASSGKYFVIHVVAGVYEEYVSIAKNKQNLMMIGDGVNQTVITGNHSVDDGWTTFNSATFAVVGHGFVAINITFRNTAGAIKHQAVAVRNGADLSAFYNCSFEGYQDTLYTHSLRQFYRECDIYGTIDFIFGNAAVVFQDCNMYARLPLSGQFNTITAQGRTDINQNTGTSVQNCSVRAADDLASSNGTTKSYLGRPWKQYSRTIFMQSFMDSLIDPAGWYEWSGDFALSTLYYAEYNNTGPGSDTSNRVIWPGYHVINATDATDAADFTVGNFIMGDVWLPATGVPFFSGLL